MADHETQEPIANIWPPGTGGFSLHGAAHAAQAPHSSGSGSQSSPAPMVSPMIDYHITGDGRAYSNQVNVQWSCGEVTPRGGGFAYIPGSHKALLPMPRDERTSMDLPCVRVPALQRGDVLFFGGPTHGAAAWQADPLRADADRRAIIFFYQSKEMALGPGNIVKGAVAQPRRQGSRL
jgi:hypothetical protein